MNMVKLESEYSLDTAVAYFLNYIETELLDKSSLPKKTIVNLFKKYFYAASGTLHLEIV